MNTPHLNWYVTAFLSGLVAGILFAPEKGSVTRDRIRGFGDRLEKEWQDDVQAIEAGVEKVAGKIDGLQQTNG